MRKLYTLLLLSATITLSAQSGQPRKCYGRCLIPESYDVARDELAIYTGRDNTRSGLDSIYFRFHQDSNRWEYIGRFDQLPKMTTSRIAELEKVIIVTDTSTIRDYTLESFEYQFLTQEAGEGEWVEVICNIQNRPQLLARLQRGLVIAGYLREVNPANIVDENMKSAILEFQREQGLPMGQFDIHTIARLKELSRN